MRSLLVGAALLLAAGCGDDVTSPPPPDAGPADSGTDAGAGDAGTAFGPALVECVTPTFGQMIQADVGASVDVTIEIADPGAVAATRIDGAPVTLDGSGRATVSVPARFGITTIEIEIDDAGGDTATQLCSFLAAPSFHPANELLEDSIRLRLAAAAIADGDGMATDLESLEDVVLRTSELGLVERAVTVGFPAGVRCVGFTGSSFAVLNAIEYLAATVMGAQTVTVMAEPGLLRVAGQSTTVRLDVRAIGDDCGDSCLFDETGTVDLTASALEATLRLSVGPGGEPIVEVVDSPPMTLDSATASFPTASSPGVVEALVEEYIVDSSTITLRTDFTARWAESVGDILETILTAPENPEGPTVTVPTPGGGTLSIVVDVQSSSVTELDGDLVVGAATSFAPPAQEGTPPATLGVPLSPASVPALSDGVRDIGMILGENVFNQMLHAQWQAGGLTGIVGPDMTVRPDAIVGPDMLVLEGGLPVVSDLGADGMATVYLGGLTATVGGTGPWGSETPLRIAVTARARVGDDTSIGPALEITELTEVHVSLPAGLDAADQESYRGYAALLGHFLATFATTDGTPSLPVVGLAVPESTMLGGGVVSTGVAAGTLLGVRAPTVAIDGDHFEVVGDFGSL